MTAPRTAVLLGSALLMWLALALAAVHVAAGQPWLGLQLEADTERMAVVVVATQGPAAEVPMPGDLLALRGRQGQEIALGARDLDREPTYLTRYEQIRAFIERQEALAGALGDPPLTLITTGGTVEIRPLPRTPLRALPASFWLQIAFSGLPLLIAAAVLASRPQDRAALWFALSAVGFLLTVVAAAVYSTRELALPGELFGQLLALNHFSGVALLVGGGSAVLWHYPRPLASWPGAPLMVGVAAALAALHLAEVWPSVDLGLRVPILGFFLLNVGMAVLQWHRTRGRAVERAVLKWFLVAWFVGLTAYVALLPAAVMVVERPLVSQVAGWLALLAIYAGIAFGITRFRLFYVNTAQLLVWALSGVLVIALAAFALTLLAWRPATAMFMALAVSGWLYTPLRNFIWSRFGGLSGGMRYELLLTRILQRAARVEDPGQIERSWRATLHDAFQPGSLAVCGDALEDVAIRDDGGALLVPALPGGAPLRLEGAHDARGVFTPMDAQLADSLWTLFAHIKIYRADFARGQHEERKRLAEELQQHIEQPLEQLAARTDEPELGSLLASALDELHVVLRTLATPRRPLAELAQQWHSELSERCAAAGMELRVDITVSAQAPRLRARTALNLRRVLRESLTNAIRHAGATRVHASMAWDGEQERFFVSLCDDGTGFDPAAARRGRGLISMETRAREMDGELHLQAGDQGGTCVCLSVPLPAEPA